MTLREYTCPSRNDVQKKIVECPFCDAPIGQGRSLRAHLPCEGYTDE